ncbi:hypothetical protein Q3G72_002644 [Acer saccharum]|nr:hypothetical protein Q3G72_002644 [Acer saccharum]
MSTTEVETPTVEMVTATTTEEPKKVAKEKKPKAPKEKKPKQPKTASHPPYFQMIMEALLALNEKSGSSPYAIAKYMEEKHKAVLPANFKKILGLQLKNSAAKGKLIKIKASYKLSESGKKDVKKPTKESTKPKTTTTTVTKKRTRSATATAKATKPEPPKKQTVKKAKKTTTAKPKQPKSIKSPAAKKAKKATAAA